MTTADSGMRQQAMTTRARIVAAGLQVTTEQGWSSVTMAKLADIAGVSRQTVYNEIGSKADLAEAMILDELGRFLMSVTEAFDAHPDDLVEAIRQAVRVVLEVAHDNPLLHAVVSATHGADTELLPLLTTHSEALLTVAKATVGERITSYAVPLSGQRLDAAIDMVVRVALSHIMQPSGTPADTADDIAWMVGVVIGGLEHP